jgi:hypothetical protein
VSTANARLLTKKVRLLSAHLVRTFGLFLVLTWFVVSLRSTLPTSIPFSRTVRDTRGVHKHKAQALRCTKERSLKHQWSWCSWNRTESGALRTTRLTVERSETEPGSRGRRVRCVCTLRLTRGARTVRTKRRAVSCFTDVAVSTGGYECSVQRPHSLQTLARHRIRGPRTQEER